MFDDSNIDTAVSALMNVKFRNAGQACIAANRIIAQEKVYDQFAELLSARVRSALVCGHGLDKGVTLGPPINQQGLSKVGSTTVPCKHSCTSSTLSSRYLVNYLLCAD